MNDLKSRILNAAEKDLHEIEQALRDNLGAYLDIVEKVAGHILFSGGKRFRPLLMVLSARLCGYTGSYDKKFSTIFEYLHTATLLHDDFVDEADLRRGRPAAHTLFGNATAVLVGDFLLARSLSLAAGTDKIAIIRAIGDITEDMSQGEIHQLISKGNINLTESEYLEVIRRKTAALIQGACRTGAIIADAAPQLETALSEYGYHLGMAFQMADDLLDYTADTKVLGKETGADLREGKVTLPLIYALQKAPPADREKMNRIILDPEITDDTFHFLVQMLETHGGITYTKNSAARHVKSAKDALAAIDASEARTLLMWLADYTLERNV